MAEIFSAKLYSAVKVEEGCASAAAAYEDGLIDFPFQLQPQCMLLPHYADSSRVGYVLQGRAVVGVLLPGESKERIVLIQVGDVITVPRETYTWWYNDGDCVFSVVYLGDASRALNKGSITHFLLAGPAAVYSGCSWQLLARASGLSEEAAQKLLKSQPNRDIAKLERKLCVSPCEGDRAGIVLNVASARFSSHVEGGGFVAAMTKENLAALGGLFEFSASITRLEANAARAPGFFAAVQLVRVTRGSGRVQITGMNGACEFDREVKEGSVFVVKKYYVMSAIAGGDGLEWFSIINTEKPLFHPMVGRASPLNLINAEALGAALNASPELVKLARAHGFSRDVIVPASN
ncbi:hypothetical protein Cni_G01533 [Canna indica]|uniref:Cupin type-1 domain-containing protein n=1 Tax=Canna indica TaxID=4628 RepID=A0AAQ3JMQ5_9LILI|nr:hypothetical protein Cni_G01533 [Canna indica]